MKLNVLVVGAGMYVGGRGTNGYGTILPALYEAHRDGLVDKISVVSTNAASIHDLEHKAKDLSRLMKVEPPMEGFPEKGRDPNAYKKVLKQSPIPFDCAFLVVPDHLHCPMASDMIKAGVHTMVVKPLTPTFREAKHLVDLAQRCNTYGAVEFHKRFDEANLKLRNVIQGGAIGDLLYVWVTYSQRKTVPEKLFKGWAAKTNIFQYLGVHYADIIYFASGAKPLRVLATGQKNWLTKKGVNTYDAIQTLIEWRMSNGKKFISTILTNWVDPDKASAMSDQKITVVGTQGRYESDQKNRGVQIVTDAKGVEDYNPYFSQLYNDGEGKEVFRGYGERSIRQFLNDVSAISSGQKAPRDFSKIRPTFKESLISTAIVEAAGKSLKSNNRWVPVKLI